MGFWATSSVMCVYRQGQKASVEMFIIPRKRPSQSSGFHEVYGRFTLKLQGINVLRYNSSHSPVFKADWWILPRLCVWHVFRVSVWESVTADRAADWWLWLESSCASNFPESRIFICWSDKYNNHSERTSVAPEEWVWLCLCSCSCKRLLTFLRSTAFIVEVSSLDKRCWGHVFPLSVQVLF